MNAGAFVINMGGGVMLRIPATHDTKNYLSADRDAVGYQLAAVFGGNYLYWEDAE
jgi:hypothetical protein